MCVRVVLPLIASILVESSLSAQIIVHLSGTVTPGQTFRRSIGHGLDFVLTPTGTDNNGGWDIVITPSDSDVADFVHCLTGPLHGLTEQNLEAWPLAMKESRAVYATVHNLVFALNRKDNYAACAELYRVAEDVREGKSEIGDPKYHTPTLGALHLVVTHYELNPPSPSRSVDDPAGYEGFKSCSFRVTIQFPPKDRVALKRWRKQHTSDF